MINFCNELEIRSLFICFVGRGCQVDVWWEEVVIRSAQDIILSISSARGAPVIPLQPSANDP